VIKGKTYYWCKHHTNPMWALHNPDAFPNLCRLYPKYHALETVYNAGKEKVMDRGDDSDDKKPTAADMTLEEASAAIEESESEEEGQK
jgi:hypothetical protein